MHIIAFVLAIVVPLVVGVVLLIYVQSVRFALARQLSENYSQTRDTLTTSFAQQSARVDQLATRVSAFEIALKETSAAHLQREVAGLAGDLSALAASVKKNHGRIYAELHQDKTLARNGRAQRDIEDEDIDADLAATLALQSAPAVKPGGG